MLDHALAPVGRHDADADIGGFSHMVEMREAHRAGVKCGDLVIILIGGDERLPGVSLVQLPDMATTDALPVQPVGVGREIGAHGGHHRGFAPQQLQVIGDVARATPELPAHVRHQKGHVEDMHLVRQDVILEVVVEDHDGVEGDGTANQGGHEGSFRSWVK